MHMISMVEPGFEHRAMACEGECQKKKLPKGGNFLTRLIALFLETRIGQWFASNPIFNPGQIHRS